MKRVAAAAALALFAAGCPNSIPLDTIHCRNDLECPTGAYCSAGACSSSPGQIAAPSATAALDASKSGVTLTWPRVPGASGYNVLRGDSPGSEAQYATVADPGASASTVTWSDPSPNTGVAAYYKVQAKLGTATSALSAEVSATTVPAAPAQVTAAATSAGVSITWSASAGATSYTVLRDGTAIAPALSSSTLAYTDASAAPGTSYGYSVSASNASGAGPASASQSVTLSPSTPVLSVAQLSNSGNTTSIKLSWTQPAGATSYDVYRGATAAAQTVIQTVAAATYTDVETVNGATFHFHVVAKNAGGSVASNDVAAVTVPAAPGGVTAAYNAGKVTVSWSASPTAASYAVGRVQGGTAVTVGSTAATTLDDSTAQPSANYSYLVFAKDTTGALVSVASAAAAITTPTPAPTNVVAQAVDDTHVSISWDVPGPGVDGFDVMRGVAAGAENTKLNTTLLGITGTSGRITFVDTTGAPNTRYYYSVVAQHQTAPIQSTPGAETNALTLFAPPTGVVATAASADGSVNLTWTRPAGGPYDYDVMRGFAAGQEFYNPANAGGFVDTGTGAIAFSDTGLVAGMQYFYKVRVHDPSSGNVSLGVESNGVTTNNNSGPGFSLGSPDGVHVQVNIGRLPGFDTYDVSRATTNSVTGATPAGTVGPTSRDQLTFTDTPPGPGTYYYFVRARLGGGTAQTPFSAGQGLTLLAPVAPGAAPAVNVVGAGAGQVLLSWTSVAGATSYKISRVGATSAFTASANYFTDSGLAPGTYQYSVQAANSAGTGPASATVSATVGSDPSTVFYCNPKRVTLAYTDGATQSLGAASGAIVTPGGTTNFGVLPDGSCMGTLPATGVYWIKVGQNYLQFNSHSSTAPTTMDLSREVYGRITASYSSGLTPFNFTIANLSPWTAGSHIELFSSNVLASGYTLEQTAPIGGIPAAGDTALKFTADANAGWGINLDTAAGDKAFVVQLTPQASSNGFPYTVATRAFPINDTFQPEGRQTNIGGSGASFQDTTATATSAHFVYLRSKFKALAPLINPLASTTATPDTVSFFATPKDGNGLSHPLITGNYGDVLSLTLDNGVGDVDAGNLIVPTPYPSNWAYLVLISGSYTVPLTCGTAQSFTGTPAQYVSGEEIFDDLNSVLAKAATGYGPPMSPASSPKITDTAGAVRDAFADQIGVGLTPTLSWAPVLSNPAPNYYRVFIFKLTPSGATCLTDTIVAQIYTTGTSVIVPPGVLVAGNAYFAAIRPTVEPQRDLVNRPFIRGDHEFFVETVTNRFVP